MFDALFQDLRYATRTLRSSPGFAAVAILSLALGIGANTAIFSLIDSVMLKYLPVRHPEQLLQVLIPENGSNLTNPLWEQIRNRQDVFSGVFSYSPTRFNLAAGGEARNAEGCWVSGQYFETLGVQPLLGRMFKPADDKRGCPGAAVLSYGFWQKEFGGAADVLEKTISLDSHRFPVIGVIQLGFGGVDIGTAGEVYLPICAEPVLKGENSSLDRRSNWWQYVIGRPSRLACRR
jgi:putative ABC transport system permease protein